jgi:hypothetical protein
MSARGFAGSRVEENRAGITATTCAGGDARKGGFEAATGCTANHNMPSLPLPAVTFRMLRSPRLLMNWKSTAAVSTVTVMATWLGLTPSSHPAGTAAPAAIRPARATDSADIEEQAARLQSRLRGEAVYRDPTRNPFRFTVRPLIPPARVSGPPAAPVAALSRVDVVPFTLSGMATDLVEGQPQRTAILSTGADVVFAKQGDRVGTYTVGRIDDTGVELIGADGTVRQLALTP